jgi:proline iminopeptidase
MKTTSLPCPVLLRFLFIALLVISGLTAQATSLPTGVSRLKTSDGVELFIRVAGQGQPCLLVHGGPGAGSEAIETLAGPLLERQFQMIYLDQRGSGRSGSSATKAYRLDRVTQDVEEVRQQLHLERWTLLSHSFGGLIATAYASKYPQRVTSLILVNSILNLPASMESFATAGYALLPTATRPPLDANAPLPQRFGMVSALLNQQRLLNKLMFADDSAAAGLSRFRPAQPANHDFAASLYQPSVIDGYLQNFSAVSAQLTMPVLVLPGQRDNVTGPAHYQSFHFPKQQVVPMPGGHYAFFENPREFEAALAGFSRQLGKR